MKINHIIVNPWAGFLCLAIPATAAAKDKKKHSDRGMLESMEAIRAARNKEA